MSHARILRSVRPVQPCGHPPEDGLDDGLVRNIELAPGEEELSSEEPRTALASRRSVPGRSVLFGALALLLAASLVTAGSVVFSSPRTIKGATQAAPSVQLASAEAVATGAAHLVASEGSVKRLGPAGQPAARPGAGRLQRQRRRQRPPPRMHIEKIFSHLHLVVDRITNSTRRCEDDEEKFEGMCYRKCVLLTNGQFPIREAPDACRRATTNSSEAGLSEVSMQSGNCSGYQVGGSRPCPHAPDPSECDENEEMHLGFCYMKCKLLSHGDYPIRQGTNVCCDQEPCLNISRLRVSGVGCSGFGIGGGLYKGHECAHLPDRRARRA